MTDLRKAAEMAFAKLEHLWEIGIDAEYKVELLPEIEALRQALAQPEQEPFKPDWVSYRQGVADGAAQPEQEPVKHAVIAGVLFDFMGWLTSRQIRLVLSASDDASPAVKVIEEFAKMRGLSLDDAKVKDWQDALAQSDNQEPVCDKDPSLCGFTLCQLAKVCKHTPRNTMPTKIFRPNLEQILNAAGFYRREWVCKNCGEQNVD